MTEQGFEQAVEQSVDSFANWAWQYEFIIGVVLFIILLILGFVLIRRKKRNAGFICMGVGGLIFAFDVIKALFRLLLE